MGLIHRQLHEASFQDARSSIPFSRGFTPGFDEMTRWDMNRRDGMNSALRHATNAFNRLQTSSTFARELKAEMRK